MSNKVWVQRLSFNLSRKIRWGLALSLTFGLQFGAGMRESPAIADSRYASTPAQGRSGVTARRIFDEGETLQDQGTAESLRLAVKKNEEALSLWRAIGDRHSEAKTLNNIGLVCGFWMLFWTLIACQWYWGMRVTGRVVAWWRIAGYHWLAWNVWSVLTPVVLLLGRRFPLTLYDVPT